MRPRIFNPNTTHSLGYYKSVLLVLIDGNADGLTYPQIADRLNGLEIKTAAGLAWSAENVKGVLKKIRLYREYPSKIHHALLELVFNNELTVKETLPLFQHRRHGTM
jgi:hypothetical protein